MPALKDIPSFRNKLANSELANSPMWDMQADSIIPAQLFALRAKLKLNGVYGTRSLFKSIVESLEEAKKNGDIKDAPILNYREPKTFTITSTEMREGFERMGRPTPSAIMFGLETGLDPDELVMLTWSKVRAMSRAGRVKTYARSIVEAQTRHISCKYVFWKQNAKGVAQPLFGLELDVFDEYKMVWSELVKAYRDMNAN